METLYSVLALAILFVVSCLLRSHLWQKSGRRIADGWWLRIKDFDASWDRQSIHNVLNGADVTYEHWKECIVVLSIPMCFEESLRSVGVTFDDSAGILQQYIFCCVDRLRKKISDLSLLQRSTEALGDVFDDRLSDAIKHEKYCKAFSVILRCPADSEIVTTSVDLLGREFGIFKSSSVLSL